MRLFLLSLFTVGISIAAIAQKDCRNQEYQQQVLATNPALADQYQRIENFTQQLSSHTIGLNGGPGTVSIIPDVITIPVVVHILWNSDNQNISETQVQSQIDELNADYSAKNADIEKVPSYFTDLVADGGFRFVLAKVDPAGRATNGIVRRWTGIQNFGYDDRAKHTSIGGDDAWDTDHYLNIWVCNTVGGLLGYSSIPGGPKDVDGVVINTSVFGTIGHGGAYNKGRTAVHEVGHWLNLRHIWGDTYCGDDKVDDTPPQQGPNRGCPSGQKFTCGTTAHGDMYMNYMDFTDDGCMFMFTKGQRERMRALFMPGGPRNAMLASNGVSGTALPEVAPVPEQSQQQNTISITLYPNPTASSVTIQSAETTDYIGKTANIYNYMGQIVGSTILQSHQQQMDVKKLQSGIYFIRIDGIKGVASAKFIKQ